MESGISSSSPPLLIHEPNFVHHIGFYIIQRGESGGGGGGGGGGGEGGGGGGELREIDADSWT